MVGPAAERTAIVRRFGAMFVAGARLTVPVCAVVLRKAYGLGAMAMTAGDLRRPDITVAWPTGEFGGMGLEGAVRLGYRKELDAIEDPQARQARYEELVAEHYTRGKALSTAAAFEIDDVIDPADTRAVLDRRPGPRLGVLLFAGRQVPGQELLGAMPGVGRGLGNMEHGRLPVVEGVSGFLLDVDFRVRLSRTAASTRATWSRGM